MHVVELEEVKRRLFWVADVNPPDSKQSLADQKLRKWFLMRLGAIPIDKKIMKEILICLIT